MLYLSEQDTQSKLEKHRQSSHRHVYFIIRINIEEKHVLRPAILGSCTAFQKIWTESKQNSQARINHFSEELNLSCKHLVFTKNCADLRVWRRKGCWKWSKNVHGWLSTGAVTNWDNNAKSRKSWCLSWKQKKIRTMKCPCMTFWGTSEPFLARKGADYNRCVPVVILFCEYD